MIVSLTCLTVHFTSRKVSSSRILNRSFSSSTSLLRTTALLVEQPRSSGFVTAFSATQVLESCNGFFPFDLASKLYRYDSLSFSILWRSGMEPLLTLCSLVLAHFHVESFLIDEHISNSCLTVSIPIFIRRYMCIYIEIHTEY